tara:strand:- start:19 stop:339 length:321 start_codon:yes stop_codon:yes gene_type:complete
MASAYKNIGSLVGSTGDVTVYTCPTATEAVIKNINLYNSHSGNVIVYPKINDSSASVLVILDKDTISTETNTSLTGPFVLESGDTLQLNCDVASKIYVFASVLELS